MSVVSTSLKSPRNINRDESSSLSTEAIQHTRSKAADVFGDKDLMDKINHYTGGLCLRLREVSRDCKQNLDIPIFTSKLKGAVTNDEFKQMFALRNFLENYLNLKPTSLSLSMCKDQLGDYVSILRKANLVKQESSSWVGTLNRFIYRICDGKQSFRLRVDSDEQNRMIALAMFENPVQPVKNLITINYPPTKGSTEVTKCSNGNQKAKVRILPCGNRFEEWELDSAGNEKATVLILPCGNRFKEWEKDSDGNQKAKVLILTNRNRFEEWEKDSDGNEKAKDVILPCGNRYEEWKMDSDKNQKAKVLIAPDKSRLEEWEKDSAGNQKAKVLILHSGNRFEEWKKDSDGNEKAKVLITPDKSRYEEWEMDFEGNQKAKDVILPCGNRYKE